MEENMKVTKIAVSKKNYELEPETYVKATLAICEMRLKEALEKGNIKSVELVIQ